MRTRHRTWKFATALFGLGLIGNLFLSCTDTSGPDSTIAELAVSSPAASVSGVGATVQLTAVGEDDEGNSMTPANVTWSSLNPNIAVVDPTSGLATAVASGQVTVAAEVGALVAYALLTVIVPSMPPVTSWIPTRLEDFPTFTDVWGVSSEDVFVVGSSIGGAGIAHYDGTSWSSMNPPGVEALLWSVWGTSGEDVFAVGEGGTILHYDGASWSSMDSGALGGYTGVWAAAPDAVFAVGNAGADFYDGEVWSPMSEVTGMGWWVWGTSVDDVHFGGVDVKRGIWGSSASDLFAVGQFIWHFDGTSWTLMESGTDKRLFDVWGTSSSDVYAVGDSGTILHYDGSSWSPMESGTDLELWQIWGISSGDVFVVSRNGLILRGVR